MVKNFALRYISELKYVMENIPLDIFEHLVNVIMDAYEEQRSIFVMGNGGSGSAASHFACDINKGASMGLKKRFKVFCLNDNMPTMLAYANDNSYEDIFVEQLKNFMRSKDIVIGISGSGNSKNVLKAVEYANENGGESLAFTGFDGGELAKTAKMPLIVPISDMQKVEDIHLILIHMMMQILCERLREG